VPEVDVRTIILRFRDLATGSGETVELHNAITAVDGYVWWAWWRKAGEKVPDDLFRRLKPDAKAGSLPVYLFDSGRNLLFRAPCTDIEWQATLEYMLSPDTTKTPRYYNERPYPAWFKLGLIEPADLDLLTGLTYVDLDAFFENPPSRYKGFDRKQVSSAGELQQQNRTIWFVRDFRAGDLTHEIELLDAAAVSPAHFTEHVLESDSRRLLWVSDTHFSDDRSEHNFPIVPAGAQYPLANRIEASLGQDISLAGVIATGDLTWRAEPAQFALAKEFFRQIGSWANLNEYRFAIVPGNHDLRFSGDPADKSRPVDTVVSQHREAYDAFYKDMFFLPANEFLATGRRFLMRRALPVEVACLNSSTLQQTPGQFQGHGYVGAAQLDYVAEQMHWDPADDSARPFRIVALHHHVVPITYREDPFPGHQYSVVLDAEALMRWIVRHRVDLVIHGHMHQPALAGVSHPVDAADPAEGSWRFTVVAMGSTGVADPLIGEVRHNTFGVLEFDDHGVTVRVRTVHPTNDSNDLWTVRVTRGVYE
jgi:3',5'-cyclic AMP phosphodiesterase CpdA